VNQFSFFSAASCISEFYITIACLPNVVIRSLFFSKLISVSNVTRIPRFLGILLAACTQRYRDSPLAKSPRLLISSRLAKVYRYIFLLGGRACHKLFAFVACAKRIYTRGASAWISIPRARCLKMIGSERRAPGKLLGASRRVPPMEPVGTESDGPSYSPI